MKSGKLLKRYGHGRKDTLIGWRKFSPFITHEIHKPIEKDVAKGIEYVIVVSIGLLETSYMYAYTAHINEGEGIRYYEPDKGVRVSKKRFRIFCNDVSYMGA